MSILFRMVIMGIVAGIFSSCTFMKLEKEVAILDQTSLLQGMISNSSPHKKPLIVLLYQLLENEKKLVAYSIHHTPGSFTFIRLPGQYLIAAFEDANEDLVYQSTEYSGYANHSTVIPVKPGENFFNLNIAVQPPQNVTLLENPDLTSPDTKAGLDLPQVRAGEIVSLEDPRFSKENGHLGLWEPIEFLLTVEGGIDFLEPFDPKKIPVIFVHGAGGYREEITSLIHHLDRTRFQSWIFNYPSGLRLDLATELMRESLSKIMVKYKFPKFVIIAYSMGGLVSRALVNIIGHKDMERKFQVLFLTLSTPWGGHQGAEFGVEYALDVIPSWLDMVPNSPFQQALFQTPLPDNLEYYLFFSFKGGQKFFTNDRDDGKVSLLSQLRAEAQEAAIKTFGFNEDHGSILISSDVAEKMRTLLTDFANRE